MNEEKTHIAGGISGAITDLYSKEALDFAYSYYEEIRHRPYDCEQIAKNTKYTIEQIRLVWNYIFNDKHDLEQGFQRFDPDCAIAHSWQRLSSKYKEDIKMHDKLLLKHELFEIDLIINNKLSQSEAHKIASEKYNYTEQSDLYYEKLRIKKRKNKIEKQELFEHEKILKLKNSISNENNGGHHL